MTTFGQTTFNTHIQCMFLHNKGETMDRDFFSTVPVMKTNRRLRPRFLYEPLSCILHTSSCLKDDPARGWNMRNKWKKSRLTIYCYVKEIEFNIELNISFRDGGNQAKRGDVEWWAVLKKNKFNMVIWQRKCFPFIFIEQSDILSLCNPYFCKYFLWVYSS